VGVTFVATKGIRGREYHSAVVSGLNKGMFVVIQPTFYFDDICISLIVNVFIYLFTIISKANT